LPAVRFALALLIAAAVASPAPAQVSPFRRTPPQVIGEAPPGTPPAEAAIWPYPAPDPKSWWDDEWPKPPEAADPLGGRKLFRNERLIAIDNGVDAPTYRLWGIMPLQWQLLRGEEMILEVWVRPARSVRQSLMRVTVRRDGTAFVQARAGYACCEAGIGRRVGFDAELPAGSGAAFMALRNHAMWSAPREVRVDYGGGAAEALCVDGASYDLTLVVPGRSRSLRRACDTAEVGEVADALEPVLRAALGHEPRFDVLYPGGADFANARGAYQELVAGGGSLRPDPNTRPQPPGFEPAPQPETAPAPPPG
jgi:hypothetical protein